MVEVIGKDERQFKQSTCRECASILRYTLNEVQNKRVSCMGETDIHYFVHCPVCSNEVPAQRY